MKIMTIFSYGISFKKKNLFAKQGLEPAMSVSSQQPCYPQRRSSTFSKKEA